MYLPGKYFFSLWQEDKQLVNYKQPGKASLDKSHIPPKSMGEGLGSILLSIPFYYSIPFYFPVPFYFQYPYSIVDRSVGSRQGSIKIQLHHTSYTTQLSHSANSLCTNRITDIPNTLQFQAPSQYLSPALEHAMAPADSVAKQQLVFTVSTQPASLNTPSSQDPFST